MFYMNFGSFNEGLQAELYKRKKNDTKYEEQKAEKERSDRRDGPSTGMVPGRWDKNLENMKQHNKAGEILQKELGNRAAAAAENPRDKKAAQNYDNIKGNMKDYYNKSNAIVKHMRRHPEAYKEYGIFAETCFINEAKSIDQIRREANKNCSKAIDHMKKLENDKKNFYAYADQLSKSDKSEKEIQDALQKYVDNYNTLDK